MQNRENITNTAVGNTVNIATGNTVVTAMRNIENTAMGNTVVTAMKNTVNTAMDNTVKNAMNNGLVNREKSSKVADNPILQKPGEETKILGIDIGGTKCAVLLASCRDGKVSFLDKKIFPTDHKVPVDTTIQGLLDGCKALLAENNLRSTDIAAAGINCGGPLDSKKGIILCPPNLVGWVNVPIVERFEKALGIRAFLQNDANAGALAEYLFGAGKGYEDIMFLTFGTGMGAGLILNGKLYSGASDMAGEVGHIRLDSYGPVGFGKAGSFEGFCSGGGIAQLARAKVLEKLQVGEKVGFCNGVEELDGLTAQSVADAAKAGDPLAREIFTICGSYLGKALSLFIDILNPQRIFLGSIYGRCRELLEAPCMEVINRETIPFSREVCRITESSLGEAINDYEAIAIALYGLSCG